MEVLKRSTTQTLAETVDVTFTLNSNGGVAIVFFLNNKRVGLKSKFQEPKILPGWKFVSEINNDT